MSVSPISIGSIGQTAVYRIPLAAITQSKIHAISLNDGGLLGLSYGAESGLDLDFVKISNVLTDDPSTAAALGTVIPFDFSDITYRAGYLAPPPAGAPAALSGNTLFGATPGNQGVDLGVATLGARDGLGGGTPGGYVSLGTGGSIAFQFDTAFDAQGLYLYFGDAGGSDRAFIGVSSAPIPPLPARITIRGTEGQDEVSLANAANAHLLQTGVAIQGSGGNDLLVGANGGDRIAGGGGTDVIIGNGGLDTALYRGLRSEYLFQAQPDGSLLVQDPVAGRDGADLLYAIENLQFANVPTYRFFHTQAGGHLFTTSTVERDSVLQNLPHYRYEGETFLTADQGFPSAVPVYRFFHTLAGGHLFTTSAVEAESVRANLPHYRDEGVGFHMSATPGEGLVPIYRFFHTSAGGHLFTSSEVERDVTINTLPNYRYEGVAFYAPTTIADQLFG